jgi:hypothetical protein
MRQRCLIATAGWILRRRAVARRPAPVDERGGLPLPLGFLAGTLLGAAAFARLDDLALVAPAIVIGGLALWAARCSGTARMPDQP